MKKTRRGLNEEEVRRSRGTYGDNSLPREKTKGFFRKFFENLGDPIIKVLLIALLAEVVFTLGRCNRFEVGGILLAVLIATTVSTASEYGSERAFAAMQAQGEGAACLCVRDGAVVRLRVSELDVVDVVLLSAGEQVPADGTMLSGRVRLDLSALNGESADAEKRPGAPSKRWDLHEPTKVYRGAVVTEGEGEMEVGRVGGNTYYGMVAKDVQEETRESPLKLRLSRLAGQISRIGYVMAAFVALTYLFNRFVADNGFSAEKILSAFHDPAFVFSSFVHALTLMITVVVVAVPEGLPMMITVVLSANMRRMQKDGVLVKKLVGIETAGSMNLLFTDKTGTLTTGKLECERILTAGGTYRAPSAMKKAGRVAELLTLSAKYNTDAVLAGDEVMGGNGTDRAIAAFFRDLRAIPAEVLSKTPFSSEKKFSAVTLDGTPKLTLCKGAPETLLSGVRYALREDGQTVAFDPATVLEEYRRAAERGERVLAATCRFGEEGTPAVFLALFFLKDKLRRGVRSAVRDVRGAGIQVVMVTGDGKETAAAIAAECGIFRPNTSELVLGCDELRTMTDGEIAALLPRIRVIARALPQDKTRLVRIAEAGGAVVGMTGDGINDAPSLKLADVGFAMGSGTDIAKNAGDIVILHNGFAAIGKTVLYGRTIFKSIRKFITFQLIMNLVACGVSLIGQFIGIDNPITIIQMLWVNIIMDTLGGLAFAGEAPHAYYMKEKPKRREEAILSRQMIGQIALTGSYTLSLCILFLRAKVFRTLFGGGGEVYFLTAFYALFIFAGLANCLCARSERLRVFAGIGKNKPFVLILLLIAVIQVLMIYYGGALFRTEPLAARDLFRVIALAATVVPFDILRRVFAKLCGGKRR